MNEVLEVNPQPTGDYWESALRQIDQLTQDVNFSELPELTVPIHSYRPYGETFNWNGGF